MFEGVVTVPIITTVCHLSFSKSECSHVHTLIPNAQRRLRTIKIPCIAGHTEHAHHSHLAYKFIHRLCGDMLTQRVEVGCVGGVQFLWRTCLISERAQPPLPNAYA